MSAMSVMPGATTFALAGIILSSLCCADPVTDPASLQAAESTIRTDAVALGEATASVRWNAITRDFIAAKPAATKPNPVAAFRAFAYLSLGKTER